MTNKLKEEKSQKKKKNQYFLVLDMQAVIGVM